jgi:hypothetical protein
MKKAGNPEVSTTTDPEFPGQKQRATLPLHGRIILRRFIYGWAIGDKMMFQTTSKLFPVTGVTDCILSELANTGSG